MRRYAPVMSRHLGDGGRVRAAGKDSVPGPAPLGPAFHPGPWDSLVVPVPGSFQTEAADRILWVRSAAETPFGRKVKSPQILTFGRTWALSPVGCAAGDFQCKSTPSSVG